MATLQSQQSSKRDVAGHTRLKFRRPGGPRRDLKRELELREKEQQEQSGRKVAKVEAGGKEAREGREGGSGSGSDAGSPSVAEEQHEAESAHGSDSESEASSSGGSDSEDETAAIMRELENVKRERAERAALEAREAEAEGRRVAGGNPLLNLQAALGDADHAESSVGLGHLDEDVVFRDQAPVLAQNPRKEFVNDLTRSDFHKRFMKKYIA